MKESLGLGAGGVLWGEQRHGGEGECGFSAELEMAMNGDLLGWGAY